MPLKLIPPGTRKGNLYWIVRGSVRGGREVEVSTRTTDAGSAERFAAELEVKLWAESREPAPSVNTWAGAAAAFKAAKNPSKLDRGHIDKLIGHFKSRPLASITPGDFLIAANILKPRASNSTKNRHVVAVGAAIMHYAAEQGWCPYQRIRKFETPRPETKALKAEDAQRMILAAEGKPAAHALLCLLFFHGWRISEALQLRWPDVDLVGDRISKAVSKKGGTRLWKLLDPSVKEALQAMPGSHEGRVFPWHTRWGAGKALREIARPLGLHFSPHMARHTMATQAISAGADLKTVMKMGDWKNIQSVLRYADSEEARQKQILDKIGEAYRGATPKVLKNKTSP